MNFLLFLLKIVILFNIQVCLAFPSGAPLKHCGDMNPSGHHADPVFNSDLFNIKVSPNNDRNCSLSGII
jgi:hypothetical protein